MPAANINSADTAETRITPDGHGRGYARAEPAIMPTIGFSA